MVTKKKRKLSPAVRAKLRRQAMINFGLTKSRKRRSSTKMVKRKRVKRRVSRTMKPFQVLVPSAVYGAGRGYLSNLLSPITSRIPLGAIGDEIGLFVLGNFLTKKGGKMTKDVGKAMMFVEGSRIGEALISGSVFGAGVSKTNNGGNVTFSTIS